MVICFVNLTIYIYLSLSTADPTTINVGLLIFLIPKNLQKYLDEKYWTSIVALHWMATFIDPSFKQLEFIPTKTQREAEFKCKLQTDIFTHRCC